MFGIRDIGVDVGNRDRSNIMETIKRIGGKKTGTGDGDRRLTDNDKLWA